MQHFKNRKQIPKKKLVRYIVYAFAIFFMFFSSMLLVHYNKAHILSATSYLLDVNDIPLIKIRRLYDEYKIEKTHGKVDIEKVNLKLSRVDSYKLDKEIKSVLTQANPALPSSLVKNKYNAEIEYLGNSVPVKVRLKGDNDAHLRNDIFSLRIKAKGKDSLFGMKNFDIQHPSMRSNHYDLIVRKQIKKHGIITPNMMFVRYYINDKYKGIALIEEIFSADVAAKYKRREGISLKFKDDYYTEGLYNNANFVKENKPYLFDFQSQEIVAVNKKSIKKRYNHWIKSTGILKAFQEDKISAENAFDIDKLLKYFAVAELWGAWHTTLLHNLRFYYNPISSKLECWWWDARPGWALRSNRLNILKSPFVRKVLSDHSIYVKFKSVMIDVIDEVLSERVKSQVNADGYDYRSIVRASKFPIDDVLKRAIEKYSKEFGIGYS